MRETKRKNMNTSIIKDGTVLASYYGLLPLNSGDKIDIKGWQYSVEYKLLKTEEKTLFIYVL